MDELELDFSDVVLFELPSSEHAEGFRARFRPRWPGWSHEDDGVWLFAVDVSEALDDLPVLLRAAQELIAELGLLTVCFFLDGRLYVLEPADVSKRQAA